MSSQKLHDNLKFGVGPCISTLSHKNLATTMNSYIPLSQEPLAAVGRRLSDYCGLK